MAAPLLFSADQSAFADAMGLLAAKELAAGSLDRATSEVFPAEVFARLAQLDLLGLLAPGARGGQGSDHVSLGIALEAIARHDFNASYLVFSANVLSSLLSAHLPHDALLEGTIHGRRIGCLAVTEPRGGSDAGGASVRAEAAPGGWRLFGEKTSVTLSGPADHAVVFATVGRGLGPGGILAAAVDLDGTVSRQVFADPGFRPLGRGSLTFDGTFVPAERVLAPPGRGLQTVLAEFDFTRPALALMCVGAALAAIDRTVDYATQREAFGRKISSYQGVSFPLVEHRTVLEGIRWLAYRALALRDAGLPHTIEAAMVKWWAPRAAVDAINECVVAHGHVGWSMEMPLMQLLNDVSGLQIGDGTPQIQKLIIARDMFGREHVG